MRSSTLLLLLLLPGLAPAQTDWNKPFPAHKVIGNVYYVGTDQLATFLITTPEGHILINSDFESSIPVIRQSVEQLGFKLTDIKIILGSHAHGDHMEGDALLKELTGARVMAMEQDVPLLRAMRPGGKEHPIDRVLKDGDTVTLGGTTLTAHLTAGHTPGCTTWTLRATEAGRSYDVMIVCSVGVNANFLLVNNPTYPSIADDYRKSFAKLRSMRADVFLGAHGSFYDLPQKYARWQQGGPNPFIDDKALGAYLDRMEAAFNARLREQQEGKLPAAKGKAKQAK
jgi:metallo-beta-lactamase class B